MVTVSGLAAERTWQFLCIASVLAQDNSSGGTPGGSGGGASPAYCVLDPRVQLAGPSGHQPAPVARAATTLGEFQRLVSSAPSPAAAEVRCARQPVLSATAIRVDGPPELLASPGLHLLLTRRLLARGAVVHCGVEGSFLEVQDIAPSGGQGVVYRVLPTTRVVTSAHPPEAWEAAVPACAAGASAGAGGGTGRIPGWAGSGSGHTPQSKSKAKKGKAKR